MKQNDSTSKSPPHAKARKFRFGLPAALFLLVTLLYMPSVRNGFVYDDETLILKEDRPDSVEDFTEIFGQRHFPTVPYYRPISRLTFRLQHAIHGKDAAPFHAFNAVLAGLTALAAYGLMRGKPFNLGRTAAAIVALVFMAHPVASSTVYPACSGRETLLPAFFMLLSMQCWLMPGARARTGAVVLWALALFSKEQAIVLPVLFLLSDTLDLVGDKRLKQPVKNASWYGAMAVVAIIYLFIRRQIFGGSEWVLATDGFPWRPLLSYVYAMQSMIAPFVQLAYEPPPEVWLVPPWRAVVAAIVAVALALAAWRVRGSVGRITLFWLAWYVIIQLPTANILEQEAHFDERYVFLAGLAVPALAASVFGAYPAIRRHRHALLAAACGITAVCAAITLGRCASFRDDLAFSRQWVKADPGAPIPWNNIGVHWLNLGDLERAEPALLRAVETGPEFVAAYYNYGLLLFKQNRPAEAVAAYEHALRLDPKYPADYNLALALQHTGETARAEAAYLAAIRKIPDNPDAHYNLGLLRANEGRLEAALGNFAEASRLRPDDPDPIYNAGVALEQMGRTDDAMQAYETAKSKAPRRADIRQNLANILLKNGRVDEAAAEYDIVLELEPENAFVRDIRNAIDKNKRDN